MTYAEKNPDPGPLPDHPGECPSFSDKEKWRAWSDVAEKYNKIVNLTRKNMIAVAVDKLTEKKKKENGLEPADSICLIVGIMVLEDTFKKRDHLNPMGGIFESLFG